MTIDELLAIPAEELALLTDEQLAERLAPLLPAARLEYIGPRTQTIRVNNVTRAKKAPNLDFERLNKIFKEQGLMP